MRTAEHVVDLEEGLEQQRERYGHHRRVVAAGAQHRQQQQRADQRGNQAADHKHEQMRQRGLCVEDRGGIGADTEEGRAGKVQHAGIAELDVQSERGHAVEQDRDDQQKDEMILVEIGPDGEGGNDGESAERVLMIGEGTAHRIEQPQPGGGHGRGDPGGKQRDDERLPLDREQRDQIDGRDGKRDEAGPKRGVRFLRRHHTRSLIFSRISPVGRQVMMRMTTANANTSL